MMSATTKTAAVGTSAARYGLVEAPSVLTTWATLSGEMKDWYATRVAPSGIEIDWIR